MNTITRIETNTYAFAGMQNLMPDNFLVYVLGNEKITETDMDLNGVNGEATVFGLGKEMGFTPFTLPFNAANLPDGKNEQYISFRTNYTSDNYSGGSQILRVWYTLNSETQDAYLYYLWYPFSSPPEDPIGEPLAQINLDQYNFAELTLSIKIVSQTPVLLIGTLDVDPD